MKALVLTHDRQVGLAELAVKCYLKLWEQCPFEFIIPRNDESSPNFDFLLQQKNVSVVRTPPSVRGTMSALLEAFDEDAWIYWCIDDRYPTSVDAHRMKMIVDFISSGAADSLNAIKLIQWREKPDGGCEDIQIGDRTFRFQLPASTWGFWHHHFVKAHVLKNFFLKSPAALADKPRELNVYLNNLPSIDYFQRIVFPVQQPIVEFGETLLEGRLTANACEALAEHGCPVPPYPKDPRSRFFKLGRSCQLEEEFPMLTRSP